MATERTGGGDPERTLQLLWRRPGREGVRRGPSPRLDVGAIVATAIAVADADGLDGLSMRAVGRRLGVPPMTLYTYVPGKAELLDLMLDAVYAAMPREPWPGGQPWRERLRSVADANRALYLAHPWATQVSTARPPLGPGLVAKYEHELAAVDGVGLSDGDMDAAVTLVLGFVQWAAAAAIDVRGARAELGGEEAWWERAGPLLAQVMDASRYPLAARVGSAVGSAQGAALDPERAYAFGLERILDGIGVLVAQRAAGPG